MEDKGAEVKDDSQVPGLGQWGGVALGFRGFPSWRKFPYESGETEVRQGVGQVGRICYYCSQLAKISCRPGSSHLLLQQLMLSFPIHPFQAELHGGAHGD